MLISPGARLGPYEILAPLGAGGMGEVYRARDTRLKRDVAIKVLPDAFARDPERLARFEREAEVLATLNHPNIAAIYGFEESPAANGIVLELVDGPTLADRVARGPIPVADVLPIARQIADALEAAHERGIVHRDLKPANIKLTAEGQVKVLDFGLAKMLESDPVASAGARAPEFTASPTIMSPAVTGLGSVLGTAAYMSPEQAAAKAADKRADIWSFGVILWEMLTGRRLFDAESVSHTLADVLRAPIDLARLPAATPPSIRELVSRCLERDVKSRLRDIGEARVAIDRSLSGDRSGVPQPLRSGSLPGLLVASVVAALALSAAGGLAFVHFREQPAIAQPMRFQILPPAQTTFPMGVHISPDGRQIAFMAPGADGRQMLWIRPTDSLTARALSGTENVAAKPFWSPDSRFVGFGVDGFPGSLKRVDAASGVIQTLCTYNGPFRGGSWSAGGVIVFGAGTNGIVRVSAVGGPTTQLTQLDASRQEQQHAGPAFLPDGLRFFYTRVSRVPDNGGVYSGSIDLTPGQQSLTRVVASDTEPVWVPSLIGRGGWLLLLRQSTLLAQPLDVSGALAGDAVPLAEDIAGIGSYAWISASDTGTLTYRTGRAESEVTELRWVDRQGHPLGQLGARADYLGSGVQLSRDGRHVVVTKTDNASTSRGMFNFQASRVWTADVDRGIFSRLNPGDGTESSPVISPDGRIFFSTTVNGAVGDLYAMPASGIGQPQPLVVKSATIKHPNDVSPDGRFLIFDDHSLQQRQDLWILPVDASAGAAAKPIPFLVTSADETFGQFSPDGKWIAYSSDESGRREVYVQGFAPDRVPAAAVGKWQISTAGGDKPRWRPDGKELYYIAPGGKMMAVPVKTSQSFEPGVAMPLFDTKATGFFPYDVSPDGRFLIDTAIDNQMTTASPITVVVNWQAALKR
jgi:eukaryotic-like serine/threonine-protein kinase